MTLARNARHPSGQPLASGKGGRAARLTAILLDRSASEDVAVYERAELDRAAALAWAAVSRHVKGASVISIDNDGQVKRQGRPVSVITVVNDNMPFLFNSVLGEINSSVGEPTLVAHPVLLVKYGPDGPTGIVDEADRDKADAHAHRISVVHVHVARLSDEQASALRRRLETVLEQVSAAVSDWKPMLERLESAISEFRRGCVPLGKEDVAEAVAFLEWLRDDNFTFLGMREFHYRGGEKSGRLERVDAPGLGILADPGVLVLRRRKEAVSTTPEIRAFLHGPEPLIVTKANARSVVHRRVNLDYVGVKTYDDKGRLSGELRIVGLFTSTAYTRSVLSIPYLRSKARAIIAESGFDPNDHSGKALLNVLESYPRDELFQISAPELSRNAMAILALGERPRVRALVRVDHFNRFVSILVFIPRDRFGSVVRDRIGAYLQACFDGHSTTVYPAFPGGSLVRLHFVIERSGGPTPRVEQADIEAAIRDIVRTWEDVLGQAAADMGAGKELVEIARHFPETYRNSFAPAVALGDAARVARLRPENLIDIDFYDGGEGPRHAALKVYHFGEPLALSARVPVLENAGFRVISERTFEARSVESDTVFIHDMKLESAFGDKIGFSDKGRLYEELFLSVHHGLTDNDAYNALALTAGLNAREITVLRAFGRYLQQAGIPQSQNSIAAALNRYPAIARDLYRLFVVRFDPAQQATQDIETQIAAGIGDALEAVPNIDDDTILRRYLNLIQSCLRTNYFASVAGGETASLAFKFDSGAIAGLAAPRPWREIFVYGPQVEGVHLRFGPVARGGLRWSDRAHDYRTEALGLVKTQQVKNAIIVPVGAKGSFFLRRLPASGSREAVFEAGRQAYVNFVLSLLSITDNIVDGRIAAPSAVRRHDDDDPYFVVAADKGTASFSDTANTLSHDHDFWLDDAFASGGSAGYDHKMMGITALGAWEAVKRHFREMNRDIQTSPFSVAGVGDMSGDVFGNAMLLSRQIRLIAAFDHRDIFIDPDPDVAASYVERRRLFELPRSSWQDYDRARLSSGGIIVARSQKSVRLSEAAAAAIGLDKTVATPVEIMRSILKAPVDLLWFGGIGTYLRSSHETDANVGDHANDPIRVTAAEVGARVIGEGANLAITQLARIEFGLRGRACNSDAIDNSGGVNSSDVEVNIKIALAPALRRGKLSRPARDRLLAAMTDEVAGLVLANNYRQTLAISLIRRRGLADLAHQDRFMTALERRGLLDRAVEELPSSAVLVEREARGEPLTRAEIGVLLAYAKIVLFSDLLESDLPDDPYFERDLLGYFPKRMAKKFATDIRSHRLRREIIARVVANDLVNRGGPSFINRLQDLRGCGSDEVVRAFTIASDGFGLSGIYRDIDDLDNKVDGLAQLDFYETACQLSRTATARLLKNSHDGAPLAERIAELSNAARILEPVIGALLPAFMHEKFEERRQGFIKAGAGDILAGKLAALTVADCLVEIVEVSRHSGADLIVSARTFFAVSDGLRIGRIDYAVQQLQPGDYYDGLALARALDMIDTARRNIAVSALSTCGASAQPVAAWLEAGGQRIIQIREKLQALMEGGDLTLSRLSVAAGFMRDLEQLR